MHRPYLGSSGPVHASVAPPCHRPHKGVVFLRLRNERAANKIASVRRLLKGYANQLANGFVVVTESQVRIARS